MDQTQDFKSLQDEIQSSLIATTRTSGQISSEDLGFQRSLNPEVGKALDEQSERLLALSKSLLKSAASISELKAPVFEDAEDLDNNWRNVVDVVDSLLEKTDICLDEYTGVIKQKDTEESPLTSKPLLKRGLGNSFRTQNLVKPQLTFEHKPDNFDTSPWRPLLTTKPHATVPLEESLDIITNEYDQKQYEYENFLPLNIHPLCPDGESLEDEPFQVDSPEINSHENKSPGGKTLDDLSKSSSKRAARRRKAARDKLVVLQRMGSTIRRSNGQFRYRHPYETEILHLAYPNTTYQKAEPIPYLSVETTSAIFVDTFEGVLEMLEELKEAAEIAVDLEHHDARSFVGLVSLMQISTRQKDWIVDTLRPWRQDLQILNEVFADPRILKVFHGAYMDIVWLQRDLGLYVVGLFDTHYACRSLGYAGGSLAFLLKKFINFNADKKYQLADWRIRPLPEEMFFYARSDTHFLLYIYDCLRNELLEKTNPEVPEENRIELVLQKSKETSLLRYERPVYNIETGKGSGGWYSLLVKTPALFNKEQFSVFRAVHTWRDRIARTDDDGVSFVMPNHVIFSIAKLMPMDMIALLGIAHPISHSVKSRTGELLEIIKSAKANGNNGPSMMDVLRPEKEAAKSASLDVASPKAAESEIVAVDATQLISEKSSFWGGAFGSSIWDASPPQNGGSSLRLAIPLPQLSEEVFATSNGLANRSRPSISGATQPAPISQRETDETFVIKRGTKRRSEAVSESDEAMDEGEYDVSQNEPTPEQLEQAHQKAVAKSQKQQRKAAKNLKKKLDKEASRAAKVARAETASTNESGEINENDDDDEEDDDGEPFDYSKADSVLHGKSSGGDKEKGKGNKKNKPFDPYVKSADAPKGMRRLQTERPGKSHTFRS